MMHKLNTINKSNIFYYKIYGMAFETNVEINLLQKLNDKPIGTNPRIILKNQINFLDDGIKINKLNDKYILSISNTLSYTIDENEICCYTKDYQSFISTLFNIPFSIFFLLRGEFLLHASSIVYNKKLILFCAKKGVGKSTLVNMLNNKELMLFGDDTIRVTNSNVGYRAFNYSKLYYETSLDLGCITSSQTNLAGKHYIYFDCNLEQASIGKLCLLTRDEKTYIEPLNNHKDFFKKNIVGIEYMPVELLQKILTIENDSCKAYLLHINNDYRKYLLEKDVLIDIIKNID